MKFLAEKLYDVLSGYRLLFFAILWNFFLVLLTIRLYKYLLGYPEICAAIVAFLVMHRLFSLIANGEDPTVPVGHYKRAHWEISWLKSRIIKKFISKDFYKWIRWHIRNPIHDFTHNVIGYKGFEHYTFNVLPDSEKTTQMNRWTFCFRWSGTFLWPCIGYESDNVKFYWGMHQRGVLQIIPRLTRNEYRN